MISEKNCYFRWINEWKLQGKEDKINYSIHVLVEVDCLKVSLSGSHVPMLFMQRSPTTTRPSASPLRWPGSPTSCQCGGRSSVWWEPSSSRSWCRPFSSAPSAGWDWEPFTCRWARFLVSSADFCRTSKSSPQFSCLPGLIQEWIIFGFFFMTGSAPGAHYLDRELQLLQPVDADALPVTAGRSACKLLAREACWGQRKRW